MKTLLIRRQASQKGIGLLELMLSLAIIAILLIMATRYFNSARSSQKVNETVNLVQVITSAATNIVGAGGQPSTISASSLVTYVPPIYQNGTTINSPFGGGVTVTAATNTSSKTGYALSITMTGVPSDSCTALINAMTNVAVSTPTCSGNQFAVTVPF